MSDIEQPKCQAAMSYDLKTECGKPATHHVPEPTDVHLCEAHAEELRSSAKHPTQLPVRRARPRPDASEASEASGDVAEPSSEFAEEQARDGRLRGPSLLRKDPGTRE